MDFSTIILFIPFVIGLAGNVGIQGATVIIRGLATGDIQSDNLKTVVKSEILTGLLNGLFFGVLCGLLTAALSIPILHVSPIMGLIVGIGVILAVSVASVVGATTPIVFLRLEIDPAISAGPFVTVMNDILGLTIYLATSAAIHSLT